MNEDITTNDPNDDSNNHASGLTTTLVKRRSYLKYTGAALGGSLSMGTAGAVDAKDESEDREGETSVSLRPTDLRVEYETEPRNVSPGDSAPRFSWRIEHGSHNAQQSAYRIVVATSEEAIDGTSDLVWDSGKVESSQSVAVPYKGESLTPNETHYWAVRLWNADGNTEEWSECSSFTTAIDNDQWQATWIGRAGEDYGSLSLVDASWIWYPEGNPSEEAPAATRYFRQSFDVEDAAIEHATLAVLVDNSAEVYLNGNDIAEPSGFESPTSADVTAELEYGTNVLAIVAENTGGPAGLLARLRVQYEDSDQETYVNTNEEWTVSETEAEEWTTVEFDDSSWESAEVLGEPGGSEVPEAWAGDGEVSVTEIPSSPLLRTEITVEKPVASARAHVVTLGYGKLYVNGTDFGDTALKPWTEFDDRVLYSTYDVTDTLTSGSNALGLWLGRGWFSKTFANWESYGAPRGLIQLHVTFEDGETRTVTTNSSWQTAPSPVLENDVFDGETYDARTERPGWATPSFDASDWDAVDELESPKDALSEEQDEDWTEEFDLEPRRLQSREVVKTLEPESVMEREDGYIVDFGQNHTGWVELSISGADAGDEVTIKHAEILDNRGARSEDDPDDVVADDWEMLPDDGTGAIYTGTLRAAEQTDVYIAKGTDTELYEPRFTYHGYRYAKVIDYPGELTADDIRSMVVHTGFEKSGSFDASNEDLRRVQENSVWGQRSLSHSIPLDCPQRDERQGWTGDATMTARSQLFNFDAHRFFEKYMDDHDDNQGPEGTQTDTIPHANGSRPADPNWARTRVTIPWYLYLHSGDTRVLSERYEGMKLYIDYWNQAAENHIIPAEMNNYGDWLAPEESEINNDLALLNTFSHYQTTELFARIAEILEQEDDAEQYRDRAEAIADAFNNEFFDPETNTYGSGDQTSYALPLFVGIVPDDHEDAVAEGLVTRIRTDDDGKIGTGFVGTRPLLFTLVEHGYIDTAYHIVSQPEEPGWVFMIRNGATTQWERWDAPDYGPDLNSLNHRNWTLISEWFYRVLAGINAAEPGFERVSIAPHIVDDLDHVSGSIDTVRGEVCSEWQRTDTGIRLNVSIPGNATGTVEVPTLSLDRVRLREGGKPIWNNGNRTRPNHSGVKSVSREDDCVVVEVGSGEYEFDLEYIGEGKNR